MARHYEDFLDALSPEEKEAVLTGDALVGDPRDALPYLQEILPVSGDLDEMRRVWKEKLATFTDEQEPVQIAAHFIGLVRVMDVLMLALKRRARELHAEHCEHCREKLTEHDATKRKARRALNDALQALMESLEQSDEPWRGEGDDE